MNYTKKAYTAGKFQVIEVNVADEYLYFLGDKNITFDVQRYSQIVGETEEAIEMAVDDFIQITNNISTPKYSLTLIDRGMQKNIMFNVLEEVFGLTRTQANEGSLELDEYGQYKLPTIFSYEMVNTYSAIIASMGDEDGEGLLHCEHEEITGDELITSAIAAALERANLR